MNKNPKFDMEEWAKLTAPFWIKLLQEELQRPTLYDWFLKIKAERAKDKINWNNQ